MQNKTTTIVLAAAVLALVLVFAGCPDPLIPASGVYTGTFWGTTTAAADIIGTVEADVDSDGNFTGSFKYTRYDIILPFSGVISDSGAVTGSGTNENFDTVRISGQRTGDKISGNWSTPSVGFEGEFEATK